MKMPGGDVAIVDLLKLTEYCLNPDHERGKHKARVFAALGFSAENAGELRRLFWQRPPVPTRSRPRRTDSAIAT
jgi:hypothetical protein